MKKYIYIITLITIVTSCNIEKTAFDASGVFEATETVISAQAKGQIIELSVVEGQEIAKGKVVGKIDCADIVLQKAQIEASIDALSLKKGDARSETSVIAKQITSQEALVAAQRVQYNVIAKEKNRIQALVDSESAPTKQLDDVQGQLDILNKKIEASKTQIDVLKQKITAQKSGVSIRNRGLMSAEKPLQANIDRLDNLLSNCEITNPINGTVIAKYIEKYEIASPGKPLYKIANLSDMILRAYITGDQMESVKLGNQITIYVDKGENNYQSYPGTIQWISDKAEFTPKTIQTKNERANLVYAVKVAVKNDGYIRIGMYGEIEF